MELHSLSHGRYNGYTEFLFFLQPLQLNSISVPWIDQVDLIEIFLQLLTVSQPADAL